MDDLKGKKFLQIRNLKHRWDMKSADKIYELISKGALVPWEPEGKTGTSGLRVTVESVLDVESKGYIN